MESILNKILAQEVVRIIIAYINSLSPTEYWIIVVIIALLILVICYRWFGPSAAIGFTLLFIKLCSYKFRDKMLKINKLHKSYKMGDSSLHVLKGINLLS